MAKTQISKTQSTKPQITEVKRYQKTKEGFIPLPSSYELTTASDNTIDIPELTPEQLSQMVRISDLKKQNRKKTIVSLRVKENTVSKAKELGKGYTGIMADILEYAFDHPDILEQCLR